MTFPLTYLLILYALAAFLGFLFTFFNVFHIAKFGLQSTKTSIIIMIYTFAFIGILTVSGLAILTFNWNAVIALPNIFSFGTLTIGQ